MTRVKKYKIDGEIFWAETPDSAYEQWGKGWRNVGNLESGYPPSVPVFTEHPEVGRTALELGTEIHNEIEKKWSVAIQTGRTDSSKPNISNARREETEEEQEARYLGMYEELFGGKVPSAVPGIHQSIMNKLCAAKVRRYLEDMQDNLFPTPAPELPKNSREFRNNDGKMVLEFEDECENKTRILIELDSTFHCLDVGHPGFMCDWKTYPREEVEDQNYPPEVIAWLEYQWTKHDPRKENLRLRAEVAQLKELLNAAEDNVLSEDTLGSGGTDQAENDALALALEEKEKLLGLQTAELEILRAGLADKELALTEAKDYSEAIDAMYKRVSVAVDRVGKDNNVYRESRTEADIVVEIGKVATDQKDRLSTFTKLYTFIWEAITGDKNQFVPTEEGVKSLIADMMHGHPCAERCEGNGTEKPIIAPGGECVECHEFWPHRPEGLFNK